MNWQPIETAPKDGSQILLYRPFIMFVGFFGGSQWCYNAPAIMRPPPTHWMPLPDAPERDGCPVCGGLGTTLPKGLLTAASRCYECGGLKPTRPIDQAADSHQRLNCP